MPGRSTISTSLPSKLYRPVFLSTVTPGQLPTCCLEPVSRLNSVGISSTLVKKPKEAKEGEETTISLLEEGKISYVISTSKTGRQPGRDSVRLRRKAVELGIPCLTSLDTAAVLALTLESQYNEDNVELVDIAHIAHGAAARKELSQMEKPEEIQIPGYVLQEHEND
jgi:carbamoyl-phosphate synthase large subunit